MILIFSIVGDQTTTDTLRWLHHLGLDHVVRLNQEDLQAGALTLDIRAGKALLEYEGRRFSTRDVDAVWYRKGDFQLFAPPATPSLPGHPALAERLLRKSRTEGERMSEYVHHLLARAPRVLGHARIGALNKLMVLDAARRVGLDVPEFMAANHRQAFADWAADGDAVVKAASDGMYLWDFDAARRGYFSYTESLDAVALMRLPERLPPSFAQRQIRKAYEVRVFYLDGDMYAMAILSQNDEKTRLDYRKYNYERPNRNAPYALPASVAERIVALFLALGLNTGSVDLIVDEEDRHVFLEINPSGEYGVMTYACNYSLHAAVAAWLAGHKEAA